MAVTGVLGLNLVVAEQIPNSSLTPCHLKQVDILM
jgi:hypothetical protein